MPSYNNSECPYHKDPSWFEPQSDNGDITSTPLLPREKLTRGTKPHYYYYKEPFLEPDMGYQKQPLPPYSA